MSEPNYAPHLSFHRVRFHDVDHAGIVFFAKIQQYCHDAMEDMQRDAGVPLEGFFVTREIGAPLVNVNVNYHRPLRHGEEMRIETAIVRVGRSSVRTRFRVFAPETGQDSGPTGGVLAAEVTFVQSYISTKTFSSTPVPTDILEALSAHIEPETPA